MSTTHTPGPWFVANGGGSMVVADRVAAIAETIGCGAEANARLIAAAPELLRVAKSVSSIGFHTMPKGQSDCVCSRCEMVREARAAIFKATGEKS